MIQNKTSIRVRYVETDAMGFAHHANYLAWFELARIEFMDALDMPYKEMEKEGYLLPVLGAHLKYKKPAHFDDQLIVICTAREKPRIRLKMEYEVFRGETLIATGSTEHAFMNPEGMPIRPPQKFVELFEQNGASE